MKNIFSIRSAFLAVMVCSVLTDVSANAAQTLIKEQPHRVYHVIRAKTLALATKQLAIRSGISFKINDAIQSDIINKKLAADNWKDALFQLLADYNFTTELDHGILKSVIITGRNGSGENRANTNVTDTQLIATKLESKKLPLRYQKRSVGSVMPITLPMAKIMATALGKKILLDLPIGQYTINHDDFVDDGNGGKTWMGYLDNEGKGYRIYLSQGEAGLMGRVTTPDGAYEIETVDGNTYLVDQVRSGLTLGGFDNDQVVSMLNADFGYANSQARTTAQIATIEPTAASKVITTTIPVVDVMVLYTTSKQTPVYARQRIKYLVNITNRAYKDSFIKMQLRLVHTHATNYVEKSPKDSALTDLKQSRGAFAGTAALRTQYGADLVLLFRPYYASTSGGCGVAYIGFLGGSGANPGTGFGVISDGNSKDAPTNYYCGIESFAHEVGHTLGNVHDREYSNSAGKFPYSYAWGIDNQFGTIMSYYGPSLMLFSTPKLATQCAGQPCGYAAGTANSSDQSRTINYTAPLVAKYKPKTIITPVIQ